MNHRKLTAAALLSAGLLAFAPGGASAQVCVDDPARDELAAVAGVGDLEVDGDIARCTVTGSIDPLVKVLAAHELVDLVTEKPSLEEAFLTYYGGAGAP